MFGCCFGEFVCLDSSEEADVFGHLKEGHDVVVGRFGTVAVVAVKVLTENAEPVLGFGKKRPVHARALFA